MIDLSTEGYTSEVLDADLMVNGKMNVRVGVKLVLVINKQC